MASPELTEVLQALKADLTVDYIESQGARLPLPLARELIAQIQAEPTILNMIPLQTMRAQIEPVGPVADFVGNGLMLDVPGTSSTSDTRVSLDISSQTLTAVNYKAVTELYYQVERENVIKQGIGNFIRDRFAKLVSRNAEKIAIQGDTLSGDTMLATNNGWIKQAKTAGYYLDWSGAPVQVDDQPFYSCYQAIDPAYLQNPQDCMFLVNPRAEGAYAAYLQNARNAMGNRRVNPDYEGQLEFFGIALRRCYQIPQDTIMLVPKSNLVWGIWQEMNLKEQEFVDPGFYLYVLRISFDVKFIHPAGVMVLEGLDIGTLPSGS